MITTVVQVATSIGPARLHVAAPEAAMPRRGTVFVGHGAGGGVGAIDLQALARALPALGWTVALVESPWRVAGRRVAGPPATLDTALTDVIRTVDSPPSPAVAADPPVVLARPYVFAGRSAGARVSCRLAEPLGAAGVIALSFPLMPPSGPTRPRPSRLPELRLVTSAGLPLLVIQGHRDPYGDPAAFARLGIPVVAVPGTHSFTSASIAPLVAAAQGFLTSLG